MMAPATGDVFYPEPLPEGETPVDTSAPWSNSWLALDDRRAACAATPTDSSDRGLSPTAALRDPSEAGARGGDGAPLAGHPRADALTLGRAS